ncbi:MAG: hypothetical protein FD170_1972 [Bacteroidetes bacterium]|nr:MAG: hypothetical protein FD170_1972 [Bacteroidota bacterium]
MNKRERIRIIRDLSAGSMIEPIKVCYIEAKNGNDLIIKGNYTPDQIKLIESGKVKTIEDFSGVSTEMLKRIESGFKPKVYLKILAILPA